MTDINGRPEWAAFNPERRLVHELKKNPRNAKTHPPSQIEMVAASIREFGWTMPLLIDEENVLLAGHARLDAAALVGITEVPVIVARNWSETQKKAYCEADNRLAELGVWNEDLRKQEIEQLLEAGFRMEAVGWDSASLDELLGKDKDKIPKDPDKTPAVPTNAFVRAGDVWQLDRHRIVCGDATVEDVWRSLFHNEPTKAAMVFTDPPYGVSYESHSGSFQVIEGDHKRRDDLFKLLARSFRSMCAWTDDRAAFYVWHASVTRTDFSQALVAAGLVERQYLIWAKPAPVIGHSDYHWTHEPCFYASKQARSPRFYGDRSQTTVWRIKVTQGAETATVIGPGVMVLDGNGNSLYVQQKPPKSKKPREVRIGESDNLILVNESGLGTVWEVTRDRNYEHPTQKPVELATRAIENSSQRDEIVIDCFAGSGTTIIGAEMTGRRAFCIEMDPSYAQVCIERWQEFSGKTARLNGMPYSEVVKDRRRADEASHSGVAVPGGNRAEGIGGEMVEQEVRAEMPASQSRAGRGSVRKPSALHAAGGVARRGQP